MDTQLLAALLALPVGLGLVVWCVWVYLRSPGAGESRGAPGEAEARATLPAKGSLLREVRDVEIEAQIRRGALFDAITLYREKTGVGHQEARVAVEAWRDRLRAS